MPRPNKQLPEIDQKVRFRIEGDNKIWHGTYTEEGFQVCNGFVCYTMEQVNYWQLDAEK